MRFNNIFSKFNYCPNCGRQALLQDKNSITCQNCGFKHYPPTPQTGAVFYKKNNEVLLVKRDHEPFKDYWSLPAGFAAYGEIPAIAALRELKEETGLSAEIDKIIGVFLADDHPATFSILTIVSVKNVVGEIIRGDDASEVAFFSKNSLPKIAFKVHKEVILKNL